MPKAPTKTPRKRIPSKKLPVPTCWYEPDPLTNPENVGCLLYLVDVDGNSVIVVGRWSSQTKSWLSPEDIALEENHGIAMYSPIFLPNGRIWKL